MYWRFCDSKFGATVDCSCLRAKSPTWLMSVCFLSGTINLHSTWHCITETDVSWGISVGG